MNYDQLVEKYGRQGKRWDGVNVERDDESVEIVAVRRPTRSEMEQYDLDLEDESVPPPYRLKSAVKNMVSATLLTHTYDELLIIMDEAPYLQKTLVDLVAGLVTGSVSALKKTPTT